MAIAKAYGSITIVDIGDLGTLSVYPESNQPTSVIYDPNQDGGIYNPSWASTNLQLTPVIYYGGTQINATDTAISVVWTRKIGSGDAIAISTSNGESMSSNSKILTVNQNVLSSDNPIITYICTVTYKEPQTGTDLVAKGQISFSLISQPTTIKSCSIVGESVFLYGSDRTIKGAESITLEAKTSNCDVASWQYKDESGAWQTISGQVGSTLIIKAADNASYFVNNVATIRLNTNIDGLYDLHSITKIYDGAAGESTFAATLSNEDMYIPCDKDGNILTGGLDNAITTITVYNGNDDVTNDEATSISYAVSGVTGDWTTKPTFKVATMTALTATVTFTITYAVSETETKTATKIFYLTKLMAGADGASPEIYSLELSTLTLNKTATDHIYSPTSFTATAWKTVGSDKTAYNGRFKIYADDELKTSSGSTDQSSISYTPASGTAVSTYKVELYKGGNYDEKVDAQTITVISDGAKGDDGAGGLSFVLGNYSDHIPCTTDGKVLSSYTLSIPFAAYQGASRVACKAEWGSDSIPSGMSAALTKEATTSEDGLITITVSQGANLGGTTTAYDTGTITFTLSTTGLTANQTADKAYAWTKNRQAAAGADAVLLRAYAPNGNIINNGENDVTLSCEMTEGSTTVTPSSYKWYVFNSETNKYAEITAENTAGYTGYTTRTLTVPATAVESYASYMVEAVYGGATKHDYISVQDKTDPLQIEIFSTLGDKITNSVGVGCIYARVFQHGTELDALQNLKVSATEPTSPSEGDVWAHIDEANQKIVLKKRTSDSWTAFNLLDTDPTNGSVDIKKQCNYTWTFGDYSGISTNLNSVATVTDKFLYIQGSYITKKMQFNLEVITKQ